MPSNNTPKKKFELTISTLRRLSQKDEERVVGGGTLRPSQDMAFSCECATRRCKTIAEP